MQNKGTAKLIQNYLENNIGLEFTVKDINSQFNFGAINSSVPSKLNHLTSLGKLSKVKIGGKVHYKVLPSILSKTKTQPQTTEPQSQTTQPQSQTTQAKQEYLPTKQTQTNDHRETYNSPPLDVAGLMHHITQIDQQNILYRNILEQIALLLEQAQIFERIK